nr:hypothetical protein [Tanacetum cinerariifolium]
TKAKQLKLATKRSKTQFHSSHASSSGDGVDTYSMVLDEKHLKKNGAYEGTDENVESESVDKSNGDDNDDGSSDDHDDVSDEKRMESDREEIPYPNLTNVDQTKHKEDVDERVHTPLDYEFTDDEKIHDEENIDEEEEDEVTKELYDDVNVNMGNKDTKITNANQGASEQQYASKQSGFKQEEEDTHVTLTTVLDTQKTEANNEIASLMETTTHHATIILEITSNFTITIPPLPLFFNPLSQQAMPTPTLTALEITTSLPTLLDFASVFKFHERVTNLEKTLSEIKQILPQAISDVATPVIKKNINESLEVVVLTRQRSRPLRWIRPRDEKRKSSKDDESSRDSRSKKKKSSRTPKDASQSQCKSSSKFAHAEETSHTIKDSGKQQDQEFVTEDNDEQPADKDVTKADWFKKPERPPTHDPDWSKRQQVDV